MKKILVPTDFSEQAENALKVAAQMAKQFNGEIYLLHMLELPLQLVQPTSGSAIGRWQPQPSGGLVFHEAGQKKRLAIFW
jgi:nucleotide-binding universal stress UspA family protein